MRPSTVGRQFSVLSSLVLLFVTLCLAKSLSQVKPRNDVEDLLGFDPRAVDLQDRQALQDRIDQIHNLVLEKGDCRNGAKVRVDRIGAHNTARGVEEVDMTGINASTVPALTITNTSTALSSRQVPVGVAPEVFDAAWMWGSLYLDKMIFGFGWPFLLAGQIMALAGICCVAGVAITLAALAPEFDRLVHQHDTEAAFTRSVASTLWAAWPDMNVLIYHNDPPSEIDFYGVRDSAHFELDFCAFGRSQGYDIYFFEGGTINHKGDGGDINWQFFGNWERSGGSGEIVTFSPPEINTISIPDSKMVRLKDGVAPSVKAAQKYTFAPAPRSVLIPPGTANRAVPDKLDGHYFLDCQHTNGTASTAVAWYDSSDGENTDRLPDDFTWLAQHHDDGPHRSLEKGLVRYPHAARHVRWSQFGETRRGQNATAPAVDSTVGKADDGKEHFWVYKGDGNELFRQWGWTCYNAYYAF